MMVWLFVLIQQSTEKGYYKLLFWIVFVLFLISLSDWHLKLQNFLWIPLFQQPLQRLTPFIMWGGAQQISDGEIYFYCPYTLYRTTEAKADRCIMKKKKSENAKKKSNTNWYVGIRVPRQGLPQRSLSHVSGTVYMCIGSYNVKSHWKVQECKSTSE